MRQNKCSICGGRIGAKDINRGLTEPKCRNCRMKEYIDLVKDEGL